MKLLVFGQGPLPPEIPAGTAARLSAPGIRAWHFGRALAADGHTVRLLSLYPGAIVSPAVSQPDPGITLQTLNEAELSGSGWLSNLLEEFRPDAAVGVSAWPSYLAALFLPETLPLWADLFGSPLAEGQSKAFQAGDDALLEPFARFERTILRRADRVSAVSDYQRYATIGALATHGRLNSRSDGYNFVSAIPATLDPIALPPAPQPLLRGKHVPAGAFVALWSGGFNTWTDVKTLYTGLETAMAGRADLYFVATGGALGQHDRQTYRDFEALVEASPYRERFKLLGWQPYDDLHNYYLEADLGLILDRWSYEGVLGSRTRLLDWLLYGLPAVVTVTAELTAELVREKLAFDFPHGDPRSLAALLVRLAGRPPELKAAARRAPEFVKTRYSYGLACQPLLEWTARPARAPDAGRPRPDFAVSGSPALERRLAECQAQIEIKNVHILRLEEWARSMEARLQPAKLPVWKRLLKKFFR